MIVLGVQQPEAVDASLDRKDGSRCGDALALHECAGQRSLVDLCAHGVSNSTEGYSVAFRRGIPPFVPVALMVWSLVCVIGPCRFNRFL